LLYRNDSLLKQLYKIFLLLASSLLITHLVKCQIIVSGTVFDSTKLIPLKEVLIQSSNGNTNISDSNGHYSILTSERDSLTFIYQNKPTAKFAVKQIENTGSFDISLHVRVKEKFKLLKEVKIYSKNYRLDSLQNREQYASIFKYQRPGISPTTDSYTGAVGMDLNELINVFRFRRNKQLRKMQERLMEQEKDNYINYRFNKTTVRRITKLQGKELDVFMKEYRPDFEFTENSSLVQFYQYILNASYQFKRELLLQDKTRDSLLLNPSTILINK
jgi:hypothetical protein